MKDAAKHSEAVRGLLQEYSSLEQQIFDNRRRVEERKAKMMELRQLEAKVAGPSDLFQRRPKTFFTDKIFFSLQTCKVAGGASQSFFPVQPQSRWLVFLFLLGRSIAYGCFAAGLRNAQTYFEHGCLRGNFVADFSLHVFSP